VRGGEDALPAGVGRAGCVPLLLAPALFILYEAFARG